MHSDIKLWRAADEALRRGVPACLIVMVDASGTVPNRPGAKLVVTGEGLRLGTVGGGPSEKAIVERAERMLDASARGESEVIEFEHSEGGVGTLCAGTQTFALLRLEPEDAAAVADLALALEEERAGTLVLDTNGVAFLEERNPAVPRWHEKEENWRYIEPLGEPDRVTIVGGGHVSLALSRVLAPLGFRIVVLDDRSGLETMEENIWAAERHVVDYDDVAGLVPEGDRSYVCIMTFAHERDQQVLRALIDKPLRYLGMMGSDAKVASIFANLVDTGVSPAALARVRAPIGVPIASDTPEEIAVSVAAELIAVRNGAPLVWREKREDGP